MYKILLKGLKFYVHLGHYETEKAVGTDILIDLELIAKIKNGFFEDDINNVVNYQNVYYEIKKLLSENNFFLLETLAANVIKVIYEKFDLVTNINIIVKKPNIQIHGEIEYVGVNLDSSRDY